MSLVVIQAALERVATLPATEAARELLFEFLDGKRLDKRYRDALAAIAERATSVDRVSVPTPGAPATELGDNYFQCPHCAEVFEGAQASACPACHQPLASSRVAIAIALDHGRVVLCPCEPAFIDPRAPRVLCLDWMRVDSGPRWFELLDDRGRAEVERQLPAAALLPNVAPVGRRDGDRTLLVHGTKYQIHVVERGQRREDGNGSATELAVRELTSVLYPDAPPEPPSAKAIAARGHATNDVTEAAIASDLENADAYSVHADWLQGQGDPRGELIALQLAGKYEAAAELLTAHEHHFFGRLATARHLLVVSPYPKLGRATHWKWGYLERLWISRKGPDDDVVEALANMLDHPSCRFLRELTVGIVTFDDNSYDGIAAVIGERSLPHLHTLALGDFRSEETELNWSSAGDLSPIYRAVPNLRSLTVRSGNMELGDIDLPALERLTIITGGFDTGSLAGICKAQWPALTSLSIQLGDEDQFSLQHLAPIFEGTRFPKVTHLGLGNSNITDEICRGLARAPIRRQLTSLDLSQGTLGDDGARALVGALPKLRMLDVSESWLTDEGIALLQPLADELVIGDQHEDDGEPDARYISARE